MQGGLTKYTRMKIPTAPPALIFHGYPGTVGDAVDGKAFHGRDEGEFPVEPLNRLPFHGSPSAAGSTDDLRLVICGQRPIRAVSK